MDKKKMTNKEVLNFIADRVIEAMKSSKKLPWDIGFVCRLFPVSWGAKSKREGRKYRGLNRWFLSAVSRGSNEWATRKQVETAGGKIRLAAEGEKSDKDTGEVLPYPVFFWSWYNLTKRRKPTNIALERSQGDKVVPFARLYYVYEVGVDTEGIEPHRVQEGPSPAPIEEIDGFVHAFAEATNLCFSEGMGPGAYSPRSHRVTVSPLSCYKAASRYYGTVFHELVHSTMKALKRWDGKESLPCFGSGKYSQEEVVAEMGSVLLLAHFGIEKDEEENAIAYLANWAKHLEDNPEWVVYGAREAEKAVTYILKKGGVVVSKEVTEDSDDTAA